MGVTYSMTQKQVMACRSSDGAFVPWDIGNDRPLDMSGLAAAQWIADGSPASLPYVAPPAPVPQIISRRQFVTQAAIEGDITQAEALSWLQGTLPAVFANTIAKLDQSQQFPAQMALFADYFDRGSNWTSMLGAILSKTDAQLDAFWTAAYALP